MDSINQQIPSQSANSNQWLRTLGIGFGIVSFGIAIGVIGYILGIKNSQTVVENQQSAVAPTAIPTPTPIPDETANWKTYTNTQLPGNALKAYSIKYPSTWALKIETDNINFHKLTLSRENNSITIYQASYGGGGCIFEGEVPEGPYGDYRNKKYTQIESDIGTLRRFEHNVSINNPNIINFNFCISTDNKNYGSPTHIGIINYEVPRNYNQLAIDEMDKIIKTLTEVK